MTSRNTKRLLKTLGTLPHPPIRPSRNGYWPCPMCGTINHTVVTVTRSVDEATYYAVPDKVMCRKVQCGHTFEALSPMAQSAMQATTAA